MDIPSIVITTLELISLGFFISAPIFVIFAIGQWLIQFRLITVLIPEHGIGHMTGLRCILYTQLSAYLLSLLIWIFWPIDPQLIMYNNHISVPGVIAELVAIPFWLKHFGYFKKST